MLKEVCGAIGLVGLGSRTGVDPHAYGRCLRPWGVFCGDLDMVVREAGCMRSGNQLTRIEAYREAVLEGGGLGLSTGGRRYGGSKATLEWTDERASSTAAHLAKVQGESPGRHCGALGAMGWEVMRTD